MSETKKNTGDIIKAIFNKKMLFTLLTGFSSGLPLLLTGSTLQAWMTDAKVDLTLIGLFSLVGLPYTLKFLWSPLMDRYLPPILDRRRGWILVSQVLLAVAIMGLGLCNPAEHPEMVALMALLVAFFSASQDIVIDAYRREMFTEEELGLASSLYTNGYRIAMLMSGAFALFLADQMEWKIVYFIMGLLMTICIVFTFFAPKVGENTSPPRSLKEAVIGPFKDYFLRKGAFEVLLFILLYKVGDTMASSMTTPFILDLGFTKTELAGIVKSFGVIATIGGGLLGGILMLKMSLMRSLVIFGIFQSLSTAVFSLLALSGKSYEMLIFTIAFENVTSGMGTAAYSAYMASLTNKRFTATQYALLSSLMGIPRVLAAAPTGFMAKNMGWAPFFSICAVVALPGLALLVARYKKWETTT